MSNELTCPKCGSEMRSYERNEVIVDQCTGCGGLFLDKGELEKLSAAESLYYKAQQPPAFATAQPTASAPQAQPSDEDSEPKKKKKSKKSFLEDLLEF